MLLLLYMELLVVVFVAVIVLTLFSHGYNAVRGHRAGSNNSEGGSYLGRKKEENRADFIN